jgi:hypothetical protein
MNSQRTLRIFEANSRLIQAVIWTTWRFSLAHIAPPSDLLDSLRNNEKFKPMKIEFKESITLLDQALVDFSQFATSRALDGPSAAIKDMTDRKHVAVLKFMHSAHSLFVPAYEPTSTNGNKFQDNAIGRVLSVLSRVFSAIPKEDPLHGKLAYGIKRTTEKWTDAQLTWDLIMDELGIEAVILGGDVEQIQYAKWDSRYSESRRSVSAHGQQLDSADRLNTTIAMSGDTTQKNPSATTMTSSTKGSIFSFAGPSPPRGCL